MALKIGLVGAGGMARYHIEGFTRGGGTVTAVADPDAVRGGALAEKIGAKRYDGLGAMLNGEALDAVSIITPNKFHAPLALEALAAGKHVFCEKPPALNAKETRAMRDAAKKAGKTLLFNFNNRARPEAQAMIAYVRQGAVGRINSAQATWIRRAGIPGFGGWFTTKALSGGGPVIDLPHMLDLALWLMGYPEPAHVLAKTFDDFIADRDYKGPWGIPDVAAGVTDVEAACHGFVVFKTGQALSVRMSWAEMNKAEEVSATFQGQKAGGAIRRTFGVDGLDETAVDVCELYTAENGRQVNREIKTAPDESMGRLGSAENFALAAQGKAEPLNTPDEAVTLMTIIDALYASSAANAPVTVAR
jgi:predicted dehydrogenase